MNQEEYVKPIMALKDGIYMIETIVNGKHVKFLQEKIEDLPIAMTVAAFEPHRKKISDMLRDEFKSAEDPLKLANTKAIMRLIDKVIRS